MSGLMERIALMIDEGADTDRRQNDWLVTHNLNMMDVKSAIEYNLPLLTKHGLVPRAALGRGKNGISFELEDGRVLKVTVDADEAKASHKIEGRRGRNVVNIIRTFRLRDSDVYGIVQERLQPLSPEEKKELGGAFKVVDHFVRPSDLGYDLYGRGWDEFSSFLAGRADDLYDRHDVRDALATLRRYSIDKMVDELHSRGISFYDYHVENVMKRGSEYVITDLGQSTVHQGMQPVKLEAREQPAGDSTAFEDELINNKDLLIKNNIRPIKFLGAGSRGEAYLCQDGRVLKVSMDRSEALASMRVMGRDIKGVVRVHRVFMFPGEHGFYGIVQERLRPLSNGERTELHRANKLIERVLQKNVRPYREGWMSLIRAIGQRLSALGLRKGQLEYDAVLDALNTYVKYGLKDMMDGLHAAGVQFHDYHVGNLMRRASGEYVITDLGASQLAAGGESAVPLLETRSDRVSVVFADLSPFNAAQAGFVRGLAREGKVVLMLRPGSVEFARLREVVEASLPDVEGRVELYSCDRPSFAECLAQVEGRSAALDEGVAVTLYSPDPRADAEALQARGSLVVARPLPGGVGPTPPPADAVQARTRLDPHVFADRSREGAVLAALGVGEAVTRLAERLLTERYLTDIGGVEGATRVIQQHMAKLQRRLRMDGARFLGAGMKGAVFDIGSNRILKITSDMKDVSSAMKLRGKNLRHVTTIHDVFQMPPSEGIGVDVFGVVADKVDVLPESESDEFNLAFSYVRESPDSSRLLSLLAANRMEEFFDALREDIQKEELENMGGANLTKRQRLLADLPKKVEEKVRQIWDVMRKFRVTDMVEELSSNGVLYADYKGDNLGKQNGDYVLLDVGGKSDGPAPPKLESVSETSAVTQELFRPMGQASMVSPAARSQSTPWSTGSHVVQSTGSLLPQGDEETVRSELEYIVREAIGDLIRKDD